MKQPPDLLSAFNVPDANRKVIGRADQSSPAFIKANAIYAATMSTEVSPGRGITFNGPKPDNSVRQTNRQGSALAIKAQTTYVSIQIKYRLPSGFDVDYAHRFTRGNSDITAIVRNALNRFVSFGGRCI